MVLAGPLESSGVEVDDDPSSVGLAIETELIPTMLLRRVCVDDDNEDGVIDVILRGDNKDVIKGWLFMVCSHIDWSRTRERLGI